MDPASEILEAVEITADFVPIKISKDTIEYNADAFNVQPNEAVEDLLKKLPGVEVDQDGNIQAQGEDVERVLVDGKEFFGTDPKMATKNLPADAVDKVKVYDRLSDMAEFSGIDDGERQKTINLELKEDKKKGVFGNLEGGYGTDNHYNAKASINRFTTKSQLSFLGMGNNINQQGFSVNEYVNFAGGMQALASSGGRLRLGGSSSSVPISNGLSDGLARTLAGGLNYNVELGKKFDLRTNYFYNNINNTVTQDVYRQNFVGEVFETISEGDSETESQGHRASIIAKYEIDSTQNIELRANGSFSDGQNVQVDSSLTAFDGGEDRRNGRRTDYLTKSDRVSFDGELYYNKKLGQKNGRVLTANLGMDYSNSDIDGELQSLNRFFESGRVDVLDQLQYQVGKFSQWHTRLSYTEPIGNRKYLEFNYRYQKHDDDSDKDIYDIDQQSGLPVINDTLSIQYTRDFSYHRAGATFRLNTNRSSLNIGLQYQDSDLNGIVNSNENPIKRDFENLLPSVRWRYQFAAARTLRVDYTTSVQVPDIEQLSPVVDNSDPLRIYLGNPSLKAEYRHRARIRFHSFSQFSNTAIFGSLTSTYTRNRIITSKSVNSDLVELQVPVNIDGDWRTQFYASFSRPVKFIHSRVRVNARVNYTDSKIYVNIVQGGNNNFAESDMQRWDRSAGLSFQSLNHKVYAYDFGGNWALNTTKYAVDPTADQKFFTHTYYVDFSLNFLKNWRFKTDFDLTLYTGEQFLQDEVLPVWTASVSRFIMKDKRGEIKLSCFDILDKNRGINRTSNSNYIQEVRSNSLGRYLMLSFVYSLKGFGQFDGPVHVTRRR